MLSGQYEMIDEQRLPRTTETIGPRLTCQPATRPTDKLDTAWQGRLHCNHDSAWYNLDIYGQSYREYP